MALSSRWRVVRRRLLQAVPVLILATFVVFSLLKLMPGDIAITLAGENATEARIEEIREIYGLNRPFLLQYGSWLSHAVQGDLSKSLAISSASTTLLVDRLVKSGHATRAPHPTDRRGVIISSTQTTDSDVQHTLGSMHQRMMAVAESMTAAETSAVLSFLESMHDVVELEESEPTIVETHTS